MLSIIPRQQHVLLLSLIKIDLLLVQPMEKGFGGAGLTPQPSLFLFQRKEATSSVLPAVLIVVQPAHITTPCHLQYAV
jgi:hypothetical protein